MLFLNSVYFECFLVAFAAFKMSLMQQVVPSGVGCQIAPFSIEIKLSKSLSVS